MHPSPSWGRSKLPVVCCYFASSTLEQLVVPTGLEGSFFLHTPAGCEKANNEIHWTEGILACMYACRYCDIVYRMKPIHDNMYVYSCSCWLNCFGRQNLSTEWLNDFMQQRPPPLRQPRIFLGLFGPVSSAWRPEDERCTAGEPPEEISAPIWKRKIIKIEPNPSYSVRVLYICIYIFIFQDVKRITKKFIVQANFFVSETTLTFIPPLFSDAKTLQQSSWNKLSSDDLENYAKYLVSSATVT